MNQEWLRDIYTGEIVCRLPEDWKQEHGINEETIIYYYPGMFAVDNSINVCEVRGGQSTSTNDA
jgi:hypothetical protein